MLKRPGRGWESLSAVTANSAQLPNQEDCNKYLAEKPFKEGIVQEKGAGWIEEDPSLWIREVGNDRGTKDHRSTELARAD